MPTKQAGAPSAMAASSIVSEVLAAAPVKPPATLSADERVELAKLLRRLLDGVGTPSPLGRRARWLPSPSVKSGGSTASRSDVLGPTQPTQVTPSSKCATDEQLPLESDEPPRPLSPENGLSPPMWSAGTNGTWADPVTASPRSWDSVPRSLRRVSFSTCLSQTTPAIDRSIAGVV